MKLIVQVYEFSIYYQFFLSKELVVILLPGTTKPVFQSCIRNGFLALMCVEICMFLSDVLPISLLWPLCLVVSIYWRILLLALHVTLLHYLRPSFTVLSCVCVCVWFLLLSSQLILHSSACSRQGPPAAGPADLGEADQNPQHYSTHDTSYLITHNSKTR